jgi:sugar phosphate isomerase/epimerase
LHHPGDLGQLQLPPSSYLGALFAHKRELVTGGGFAGCCRRIDGLGRWCLCRFQRQFCLFADIIVLNRSLWVLTGCNGRGENLYTALSLPALGLDVDLPTSVNLAAEHGFASVELDPKEVAALGAGPVCELLDEAGLGAAGFLLPVDWHGEEGPWRRDLEALPELLDPILVAGTDRAFTWIWPASDELDWDANWAFHLERLRPVAAILADRGCRLALEYVGPPTMRAGKRHEFIHRPSQALELASELGEGVGVLLDTFHWYTTGSDVAELAALPPARIAYVHVNDAPAGVAVEEQDDLQRALPGATGVIDIAAFLGAVRAGGYDGPVVCEPFEAALEQLPPGADARVGATAAALSEVLGG